MQRLDELEHQSIFLLREAYHHFKSLGMLWSIGKDSTVLLWLAKKAFLGRVPFPLMHVDTGFKIPEMIGYRDRLVRELDLTLWVGRNEVAERANETFPAGKVDRTACCHNLKTEALKGLLSGQGARYELDRQSGALGPACNREPITGVILGIRADEEGTRSKERYFSPRGEGSDWDLAAQPPEFWSQFKTEFRPGTHVRIHPLLDWTELNIWEYIEREKIPVVSLYFDQGSGKRYRSLGCHPCTFPVESTAKTVKEIVEELRTGRFSRVAERSGRAQDLEGGGTLEALRSRGYM